MSGRVTTALAPLGVVGLLATGAAAEPCPQPGAPWVHVVVHGESRPESDRAVELLRAELATRHITLCEDPGPGAPPAIALVEVGVGATAALLRVEVHDALTAKAVRRDVALDTIPPDGRPLTIALAADELLRASWAELALRSSPPPARPVPPEVRRSVAEDVASPQPPRAALGAAFAVDAFGAGTVLLGADAQGRLWLSPRLSLDARVGLRTATTLHAPDGEVSAQAVACKLGAALTVTPPALRAGLDLRGAVDLVAVDYAGTAVPGAVGRGRGDVAVVVEGGPVAWLRLGPGLRLVAEVDAALPVRPVRITDGGAYVGGVADAGVAATFGLWGTF